MSDATDNLKRQRHVRHEEFLAQAMRLLKFKDQLEEALASAEEEVAAGQAEIVSVTCQMRQYRELLRRAYVIMNDSDLRREIEVVISMQPALQDD